MPHRQPTIVQQHVHVTPRRLRMLLGALALVVLGVSVVWADGSGEIAPFPITGAYQATHRADRGSIAIIDFVGNYDSALATGENNVEARAVVAREFLRTHPDTYDFLVVFSTFEFATGEFLAFHWPLQNNIQGLGIAPYDVSHLFGSAGRLLGYTDMAALSRYVTDPLHPGFEDVLATLGHEVLHQWSGRVRFVDAQGQISEALLGRNKSHWSDLVDSNASVLYGHKWRDNHDGTFTSEALRKFFSPLDLYLAGLYSTEEVPPFLLIDNPQHDTTALPQPNITVPGSARLITIDDVIAAEGPRIPPADQAQKVFRFAWILLAGPGEAVDESQLAALEQISQKFADRFAIWTGGRAIAQVTPEALLTVTTGAPEPLAGGTVRVTPVALDTALQDGLAWLRSQQHGDGSWTDKPATQLRDTTVALEVLRRLDPIFTGQASAVAWLAAQTPQSTDYRARQAQALLAVDPAAAHLIEALLALRHAEGGWGLAPDYASDPLDTALVLAALSQRSDVEPLVIEPALEYLVHSHNPDGGWSALVGGPSRLSVTARVLTVLQAFNRQQLVHESGLAWLASQQRADGGFGETISTVHDTAQALQSCIALGAIERIRAAEAAAYLLARQQTDGSWETSTYATAVVVAALKSLHFANWRLDPVLTVDRDQPVDGDRVTLTLMLRNDSQSPTPATSVRLFDGDPASGGQPIGGDVLVPALAPGASVTLQLPWDTFGAAGEHTLIAIVDPDRVLLEVSEQDNHAARPLTVAAAPPGIDLTVEALTVMPARPTTLPTTLGISAIVRNTGLSHAEQVRVQLREGESGLLVDDLTLNVAGRSSVAANFTYILTRPGVTTFVLVIDSDNALVETNKTNNTASTTVETTPGVDVYVAASDLAVTPQPALYGADLMFTVTLHNVGTTVSPATAVTYLVTDGNRTIEIGQHSVQVEAGSAVQRTLTWRATLLGTLTFTVQLDPDHLVPERDEQNNTASFHFSVGEVNGPNVAVSFQDLAFAPDPGLEGHAVTLSALLRNTGTVESRDVVVAFYDGNPSQGGVQIAQHTLALLPADSATVVSTVWPRLPDAVEKLVFVSVDPDNAIAEFSETDNIAFRLLTVLSLPDLAIDPADIRLTPGFPTRGETVQIETRITNLGAQPATDVVVRAFEGDLAMGGVQIGAEQRVSVAGGGTAAAQFTWTLSGTAEVRALAVVVDPNNALEESSRLNNVAQKRIAVQDSDFFVSDRYISPNGDGIKDSTTFFFRLATASAVEVVVLDKADALVRQVPAPGGTQVRDGSADWDGLDERGRVVRDGSYRLQVRSPAGQSFGEAVVVVDNNRSSLVEAAGTPFGVFNNLTCEIGELRHFAVTDDEATIFFAADASAAFGRGVYRMTGSGTDVTLLVPLAPNNFITSLQIAPDGTSVAYLQPEKLFVVQGDGTNLREIALTDRPEELVGVVTATNEVLLMVQEQTGAFRRKIMAVPLFGGTPRLLYSTSNASEGLTFHSFSPNRSQFVLSVDTFAGHSYYVLDIVTAAMRQLTTTAISAFPDTMTWSPDGTKLALKHLNPSQNGTSSYTIFVVNAHGGLLQKIDLPLTGDADTCIDIFSQHIVWSPDSDALAFDLLRVGIDECLTGHIFMGGLYTADINSEIMQNIFVFDDFRSFYSTYGNTSLGWFHDTRALFYGFLNSEINAFLLDENNRKVRILGNRDPVTSRVEDIKLSPTGRQLFYHDNRDASNPQSVCYQQGFVDFWSYKSLLNLTADLQATRAPQEGGVLLQGTVSDLHFDSYLLEYASTTAPNVWQPLQPAAGQMVLNDVLATWVPPAPGTYLVRLTATDLAGNQRQQIVRVVWADPTSISDLYRAPAAFSPNGDSMAEEIGIHYRVLEPVHLAFEVYNDAGERVRTMLRDHATIGTEHTLVWDGRDDHGLRLPDGRYRLQVQNFTLPITLDTTPPTVTVSLDDPYQALAIQVGDQTLPIVAIAPQLTWSVTELHYRQAVIEKAALDRPDAWQPFVVLTPQQLGDASAPPPTRGLSLDEADRALFRLVADDTAGNRTILRVGPVAPQLIIDGFGDHTVNEAAQTCFFGLSHNDDLENCVREHGGSYHPLGWVLYAPFEAIDGPPAFPDSAEVVTAASVRFSIAESIAAPLTQVSVQYRPASDPQWQEMPLTQFLDGATLPQIFSQPLPRRMQAVWELPTLASNVTYVARVKAIDQSDQMHVSNTLRFVVENAVVLEGLIHLASQADQLQYALPRTFSPGQTGLWGLNVSREALREVRLVLSSPDDPRYRIEQEVDSIAYPGQVLIFEAPLAACKAYNAQVIGTTVTGVSIQSPRVLFTIPCLNMIVQVEPQAGAACNGPSAQRLYVRFAPASLNGSTLKVLTLSQTAVDGHDDVIFNANRPRSVVLPQVSPHPAAVFVYDLNTLDLRPGEPDYPYGFTYDTSTLAEGRVQLTARLVDINDAAIALPIELLVDHTPPTLTLTYPSEGARLCGVPTVGQDGGIRNVVTLEGSIADANGLHYLVSTEGAVIHDSRRLSSFAVALGDPKPFVQPPYPSFHLQSVDGLLAQLVDRHGEVTVQVEAFDFGGFQQCVQRTFFVDALADVDPPTLDRALLSPNGDGVADAVTLHYQSHEQTTLDIVVYAAMETTQGRQQLVGGVLRHLETSKLLLGGSFLSTWDGRDDGGTVMPDGWYGIVVLFTDTCGNQRRFERFVEVDTTPPQAVIGYPQPHDPVALIVEVQGSVNDPHLSMYHVQMGGGTAPETWATLHTGVGNVSSVVLTQWNTFGLNGPYVLRLVAEDRVGNTTTVAVPLTLTVRTNLLSAVSVTPALFSPNGDGKRDQASVSIGIENDVFFTLTMRDGNGQVQRTLATNRVAGRGVVWLAWDGTNEAAVVVPDGVYTALLQAVLAQNPSVTQTVEISLSVDSTPPSVDMTRPTQGVVTAAGQLQGSITDQHLSAYSVALTETPAGPQTLVLGRGTSNAVNANLGSLEGLQEGRYTVTIEAQDAGDNVTTKLLTFVVDNTPPVVTLTAPTPGSVVGRKQSPVLVQGAITEAHLAQYHLNVGLGADPTTWITLASSTSQPGSEVLGVWDIASLADGLYALQVLAEDRAGLHTDQRLQVTVDNTPPTVALTTPAAGAYVTAPLSITGTATDAHLTAYRLEVAPAAASAQWSSIGAGAATVQNGVLLQWQGLPLDGAYLLRLTAVDRAGNTSESVRHITVDTAPPEPLTGLHAAITNRQVHLTWLASAAPDLAGYAVYRDGQRLTSTLLTVPEFVDSTATEGRYVYTVIAIDLAGLASPASTAVTVTVDFTPPQAMFIAPTPGATVGGVVDIRGTAYSRDDFKGYRLSVGVGTPPVVWQLLRQSPVPVQADVLSQWNTVGLSEGARYSMQLEAEDLHGNVSTVQITVTIDNQPPAPPTGLTATVIGANVNLTWNANSESDLLGYLVYRNGRLVQTSGSGSDLRLFAVRTPAYTDQAVADGVHIYTVAAIDQAGNVSAPSTPVPATVNVRAPHAVMVQPANGTVFDGALYLLATVADSDVAQVQLQYKTAAASVWLTLAVDTTAPYEASLNPVALGLAFGTYHLRAVATDTTNHVDPAPTAITVTYSDRTRPQPVQGLVARVDGDTVQVQWTASGDSDLAGYHVERQRDDAAPVRLTTIPLTGTSYIDTGLADGMYRYAIIALDTHANATEPSAAVPAVIYTPLLPAPHTPTTATAVTLSGRGITAAMVTGEVVTASGSSTLAPVSTDASGNFRLPDLPLAPGDNRFSLRLTDADGNRSKPATVTVTSAQAPSQPTGLTASVLDTTVSLTWNANPETDVVGYRLWRNGAPVIADRDLMASASGLMLTWPEPRQVRQVQVQWASAAQPASDFDLEAWSGEQWVVLAQIRDNQKIQNTITLPQAYRTTQLRLVLQQAAGSVAPGVVAFGGLYTPLSTGTAYDDVVADGRYTYTLTAVNAYGLESILSEPVAVAVGDVSAPGAVVLMATVTNSDVSLSWTPSPASDVQHYELYRDGTAIAQVAVLGVLQYVDTGRINGAYAYMVTAVDRVGNASAPSNTVPVTVAVALPGAPENLTVTPVTTGSALELHWSTVAGAPPAGFRVWRGTSAGGPYTVVADTTTTSLTDTGLQNDTIYYYVVAALDAVGNASAVSNEARGTPRDLTAPTSPMLYFPTVAGRVFISTTPDLSIIGTAEPGSQVELLAYGQHVDSTRAQDTLETLEIALPGGILPVLSPDGRYVAWIAVRSPAEGGWTLRLYDSNTGEFHDVTPVMNIAFLGWSPDSTTLLFNEQDFYWAPSFIRQYTPADDRLTDLTNPLGTNFSAAVVAPDGTRVAFSGAVGSHRGLWLLQVATGGYTQVVDTGAFPRIDGTSLQWSPDGTSLAYKQDNAYDILHVPTGAIQRVETAASAYAPRWSPDGQALLYASTNPPAQIRRYTLRTGTVQDVVHGLAPHWSADGQALLYINTAATALMRRELDTGVETVLVQEASLMPATLQAVSSGFIGLLHTSEAAVPIYQRVSLAGRFVFAHVGLERGDNVFTARAVDAAGNVSPPSDSSSIAYQGENRADLTLTADALLVLPTIPRAGETARVSVTVSNSGGLAAPATTVSLVALHPAGEATVLLDEAALPALSAGASHTLAAPWTVAGGAGSYTLIAIVDPSNSVVEQSKANNVALQDLLVPSAALPAVTVRTDAPLYHTEQAVTITGRLTNGGAPWTGQVVIMVTDVAGFLIQTLHDDIVTDLAYGASQEVSAVWQTGSTFAGAYQIVVRLIDQQGAVIATATAPFSLAGGTTLVSSLTSDRLMYTANAQVHVTGSIAYISGNQVLSDVTARVHIRHSSAEVVATQTTVLGDMLPGTRATLGLDWNTGTSATGVYQLQLDVTQAGQSLSQAQGELTIVPSGLHVAGSLTLSEAAPAPGMVQTATYTVVNRGNGAVAQLPIIVSLTDPALGSTLHEQRLLADIAVAGQSTGTVDFPTATLTLQSYTVMLQAGVDDGQGLEARQTLATQTFIVTDRSAPVVELRAPAGNGFMNGSATVSLVAQDDFSPVTQTEFRIDGGEWRPVSVSDATASLYGAALPQLAEGSHTIQVRATDAVGNVRVSPETTFAVDNTPPLIVVTGVVDGGMYTGAVTPVTVVTDANIAAVLMALNGLSFVSGTVVVDDGPYQLVVTASDQAGNSAEVTINFVIAQTAPIITIQGVQDQGAYNTDITPVVTIIDAHPATQTITLNGLLFISGTVISAEGSYTLMAQATNIAGQTTSRTVSFVIDKTPPVITMQGVQDGAVYQGQPYTYHVQATDADGNTLGYTLPTAPSGMAIDGNTGLMTWWPRQPGDYAVTVRVEDPHSAADTQSYTVTVTVPNLAPQIASTPVVGGVLQQLYAYAVDAVDPNGDPLTYSLETAPAGMLIDAVIGLVTWTPETVGEFSVVVRVQDPYGASLTQSYTLRVAAPQ